MPLYHCVFGDGGGGTGSIINITTDDDGLFGQTVTLSGGSNTLSSQFSSTGKCTFKNVTMTGTLTIASSVGGESVTSKIKVPYYGTIDVNFGREMKTIEIFTEEPSLVGKTVTVTYNTSSIKTADINSSGEATVALCRYTGAVIVSASDGVNTVTSNINIVADIDTYYVYINFAQIYGVSWDGSSSPAMTRTDAAANFSDPSPAVSNGNGSSPFDNILPWSGMVIEEDEDVGTLVKIPKYYYKWTKSEANMTLQISEKRFTGSHISPAHADREDEIGERDFVYVGRYHCASDYKSTTGVTPKASITRGSFRNNIHALKSDVWQWDYAMYWTIAMLYIVEYASWDSQSKIGYGCSSGGSAAENAGLTDAMVYHTGTNAASRTTYGHVQYRHIEDLWANLFDWCDGAYYYRGNYFAMNNPSTYSANEGTLLGPRGTGGACLKEWGVPSKEGFEWALYCSSGITDNNFSTYICDKTSVGSNSSPTILRVGGFYTKRKDYGLFCQEMYYVEGESNAYTGSRLMKLPNNS